MFEFLFKYPSTLFSKGTLVLLAGLPVWMLGLAILIAAAALWFFVHRNSVGSKLGALRSAGVWLLQTLMASLLLLMLWHPALSVATLRPQQNIVAVIVDDSSSMAQADAAGGATRKAAAESVLNSGLLTSLKDKFQVRLYRLTDHLDRFEKMEQLTSNTPATHIGEGLKQVVADAASLPIGAVVLASDGADNSGGVDLETISEFRRQRIPIHTIGFGREQATKDVELSDVIVASRALPDSRLAAQVSFHQQGFKGQKAKITLKEGKKILAQKDIVLKDDGVEQTESVPFNAGAAAVHVVEAAIEPMQGEDNVKNNVLTRLVNVDSRKPRILYMEGEPRWEFKFLRRAVEDDNTIDLVTMLRTTQNKIYRQGLANPDELKDGFPTKVEELFAFDGLIIGKRGRALFDARPANAFEGFCGPSRRRRSVPGRQGRAGRWRLEAIRGYRSAAHDFARSQKYVLPRGRERRADGCGQRQPGYPPGRRFQQKRGPLAEATLRDELPGCRAAQTRSHCSGRRETHVGRARASAHHAKLWTRPHRAVRHRRKLAMADAAACGRQEPRNVLSATVALAGFRYAAPRDHVNAQAIDLRRVARHDSRRRSRSHISGRIRRNGRSARAGAGGGSPKRCPCGQIPSSRESSAEVDYTTPKPGSYLVEVVATRGTEELGRDTITLRREDGVAENFHTQQNRELLEKLASETGGRYYKPEDAQKARQGYYILRRRASRFEKRATCGICRSYS